ncbi:MAG: hypothetical protein M4579_001072 [Chaenotheca gracillima]|nr:MAG: hypothetical protein M4579_001072 [Chaenotheca gracillima]
MAKTRPDKKKGKKRDKSILNGIAPSPSKSHNTKPEESPETLLAQATELVQTSRPDEALPLAQRALNLLQTSLATDTTAQPESDSDSPSLLPILTLIAEVQLELGDIDSAREHFMLAAELDPDGAIPEDEGGGAEKFLWLAQLAEEGGAESVGWFERGASVLRNDIAALEETQSEQLDKPAAELIQRFLDEKKRRLANALCGVAEVYMTDLSWEADAEQRCESLVTEAVMLTPDSAEALQTLASVRISQVRAEEARGALKSSLALWTDLEPDDARVPEFPSRVSLARLLMETELEEEAIKVLERLVMEDDQSVEAWYLGGWAFYLLGGRLRDGGKKKGGNEEEWKSLWDSSRDWLQNALRLFDLLDYEDERLQEHAVELVRELDGVLGERKEDEEEEEEGEGWEDEDDDEEDGTESEAGDEEMQVS